MVASNTLSIGYITDQTIAKKGNYLLFRVIRRICKDSRINSALDTIGTSNHHAIFMCENKIIIEQEFPNTMDKLAPTVCQDVFLLGSPFTAERGGKVLERVGKRWDIRNVLASTRIRLIANVLRNT